MNRIDYSRNGINNNNKYQINQQNILKRTLLDIPRDPILDEDNSSNKQLHNETTLSGSIPSSESNDEIIMGDRYNTFMGNGYRVGIYTIPIMIGDPAQAFVVLLDTGSTSLNIPSKDCILFENIKKPTKCKCSNDDETSYNHHFSRGSKVFCKTPNCLYTEEFVDKSFLVGQLVQDTVKVGDFSVQAIFGNIFSESLNFAYKECPSEEPNTIRNYDGIFGLATKSLDPNSGDDILTKISNQYNISNSFSMCFGSSGYGGQFRLGGYDSDLIVEPIRYIPTIAPFTYNLTVHSTFIGDYKLNHPIYYTWIDSGSTNLILPKPLYNNMVNTMYERFQNLAGFKDGSLWSVEFPCAFISENELDQYPTLNISFVDISGQQYNLSVLPRNYLVYNNIEKCYEMLIRTVDDHLFLIGDTALIGYNVHFDKDNQRIGFAKATPDCSTGLLGNINQNVNINNDNYLQLEPIITNDGDTTKVVVQVRPTLDNQDIHSLRGIMVEFKIKQGNALFYPSESKTTRNSTNEHGVAMALLRSDYYGTISIDAVAKEVGISVSNLATISLTQKPNPASITNSNNSSMIIGLFIFGLIVAIGLIIFILIRKKRKAIMKQRENLDSYEMLLFGSPQTTMISIDDDYPTDLNKIK